MQRLEYSALSYSSSMKLLLLLPIFLILPPSAYAACPSSWANGYNYCRTVTVDHTKVPSTQTDFPVLLSDTVTEWKTVANSGHIINTVALNSVSVPADLIFTSDSAGSTLIKWEVEAYIPTTGAIVLWVKIASLSSSSDTVFYAFYGKTGTTTYQGDPTNTWETNFKGVYHLPTGSGSVGLVDSSTNAKNISLISGSAASVIAGQIDGGGGVANDFFSTGTSFGTFTFPFSYSYWANNDNNTGGAIIGYTAGGNNGTRVSMNTNGAGLNLGYTLGGVVGYDFTTLTVAVSTWYGAWVTESASGLSAIGYLCKAGVVTTQTIVTVSGISGTPNQLAIAARDAIPVNPVAAKLDELRFRNSTTTADWITTECNNQTTPAMFNTIGSEVANGAIFGGSGLLLVGVN